VLPFADGDAAVLCSAPEERCARLAASLAADPETALTPAAMDDARGELKRLLRAVTSARERGDERLPAIATAERQAAKAIARLQLPRRFDAPVAAFTTALERDAKAFRAVADRRTSQSIERASSTSRRLRTAARQLGEYGLRVPAFSVLRFPPPPSAPKTSAPPSSGSSTTAPTQSSQGPTQSGSDPPAPLSGGGSFGPSSTSTISG
jgi:hypothetical protein